MKRLFGLCLLLAGFALVFPEFAVGDALDNWHWRNPLPQGNTLRGVTYGHGVFAAVGDAGTILTSPDGATWTKRDSGLPLSDSLSAWYSSLNGLTYANNLFVAVGKGGTLITSPDGVTWTKRTSGTDSDLYGVAYGNGVFVAVGGDTSSSSTHTYVVLTSPDGITWTKTVSGTSYELLGVAYGEGLFVAVGFDQENNDARIFSSPDGITWTERNHEHKWPLRGLAYGNGHFVAVGSPDMDGCSILSSSDGITWFKRTAELVSSIGSLTIVAHTFFEAVTYGNGIFVVTGVMGDVFTSTDAVTWTGKSGSTTNGFSSNYLFGVGYANGTFVAVGEAGRIQTSPNGVTWTKRASGDSDAFAAITYSSGLFVAVGGNIETSSDGVTWVQRVTFDSTETFHKGVAHGNGVFVAVGESSRYYGGTYHDSGSVYASSDGITWVEKNSGTLDSLNGVTHSNEKGLFVAVGDKGTILTSPDGGVWVKRDSGTSNDLRGICYGSGTFVAVGWYGTILTSPDGATWTKSTSGTSEWFSSVVYANGLFVAGAFNVFTSPDGITWAKRTDYAGNISGIAYGNGVFISLGGLGKILVSFDGMTWAERGSKALNYFFGATYGKDTFVIVGDKGAILQSDVITAPVETISAPNIPSGPASGTTGVSYTFAAGGASSSFQHNIQYLIDWGDGTNTSWLPVGTTSASKAWSTAGQKSVKAQARCASHPAIISPWSTSLSVNIGLPAETVSAPNTPAGPTSGNTGTDYTYSTGGSNSTLGHSVQYLISWGDGTDSDWLPVGTTTASKSWTNAGSYSIQAQARCKDHTTVVSGWSQGLTVNLVQSAAHVVATNPPGMEVIVDGMSYVSPKTFYWTSGSSHTISVPSPQWASSNLYSYSSWSDGGQQTHNVTAPSSDAVYLANFTAQFELFTFANPPEAGVVDPPEGTWPLEGQEVTLTASSQSGYSFMQWWGDVTGTTNPASVVMDSPKMAIAAFIPTTEQGGWKAVLPPYLEVDWWLQGVHFSSPSEGWAVGADAIYEVGVLLHYSNGSWEAVEPPEIDGGWWLNGVHFSSSGDGWAVGEDYANGTGVLLHYSGGNWSSEEPPWIESEWSLSGVHFTSASEGWAVGNDSTNSQGVLLRYSGGSWAFIDPPSVSSQWWLSGVHFTSSSEGWAAGEDEENGSGVLLHYTNGSWTSFSPPSVSSGWGLNGIHFASSDDGWAVGEDYENGRGVLLHYSNGSWTHVTPPDVSEGWALTGVHFASASEGWAAGRDYSDTIKGVSLHYSKGTWTAIDSLNMSWEWWLNGVHFPSLGEGWAVGSNYNKVGVLLRYSEGVTVPDVPSGATSGISGTSYTYTTGDSSSTFGDAIEYQFDWEGDGTDLSPWGAATQSKSWSSPGTYHVKARARCKEHWVESSWSAPLLVTISKPQNGPDLAGSWTKPVTKSCKFFLGIKRCTVKGRFKVVNGGNSNAGSSYVDFYLSENSNVGGGQSSFKRVSVAALKKGKSKTISLSYTFSNVEVIGKYIIGVIDKDDGVPEIDETNNSVSSGPIR